ncbi:unnamed protein product [Miscanthus lutarioriparius]|uniref:MATH domain-containing protein n=1 Tax=Miscanthus lutarioriparius TaxID=422564 RepID=A0A811MJH4_9POAL|nr:unnamed protein product [Miscanthus lutarioriparius]
MAGCGKPSRSASTIVANIARGYHILKVDGYSCTLATTPTGEHLTSLPFTVGGHRWYIRFYFYPNGCTSEVKDYISLFLYLHDSVAKPGRRSSISVSSATWRSSRWNWEDRIALRSIVGTPSSSKRKIWKSRSISGTIPLPFGVFTNEFHVEEAPEATAAAARISVPPSDLHQHLGSLLLSEKGADVVFDVAAKEVEEVDLDVDDDDEEEGVFSQHLLTKEAEEGGIDDDDDDKDVLSQHLLVAADKYSLERLKLLCESKLCEYVDVGTVATVLALAEQHHCHGLKKVCFHFLSSPANLRAVVASVGFEHLSRSCPSVMVELVAMHPRQLSSMMPGFV